MKYLLPWALLLIAFGPQKGAAQTNNDFNVWYGFFNKTTLSETMSWWTETQLRYNVDEEEMGQTLVRTGLLLSIDDSDYKNQLGFLYAYIQSGLSKEHRMTLQHTMTYGGSFTSFSHRMRYEFRTLEQGGAPSNRFRYLIRYAGPNLCVNSSLVLWDEIFLNTEKGLNDDVDHLDRNRFFLGFRVPMERLAMEIGYLNQWAPRKIRSQMDHVATIYMFF